MDWLDLLSRWNAMKTWQKVLGVVIVAGGILFALNQGYEFAGNMGMVHPQNTVIQVNGVAIPENVLSASRNDLSNETLKNQTKQLATSILDFVGERDVNRTSLETFVHFNMSNPNDSQTQREWFENGKRESVYDQETMKIYNTKYLPEVSRIKQEFKKRNLTDPELDSFDGLKANSIDIKMTATKLLELANRLS